jgi:Tfp pilus assembly protein PilO
MPGENLIIIILAIILAYLIWDTYYMGEVEYVKSKVDNEEYLVRSLPDKNEAANLLANIKSKIRILIKHLNNIFPNDIRVLRLNKIIMKIKLAKVLTMLNIQVIQ